MLKNKLSILLIFIINLLIAVYLAKSETLAVICRILTDVFSITNNEWYTMFLLVIFFVLFLPIILSVGSRITDAIILNFNLWFILFIFTALHKTLITPLQECLLLYCLFYAYISTCASIVFVLYKDKEFTYLRIIIIFLQSFLLAVCLRYFIIPQFSELLCTLSIILQLFLDNKLPVSGGSIVHLLDNPGNASGNGGSQGNNNPGNNDGNYNEDYDQAAPGGDGGVWTDRRWRNLIGRMYNSATIEYNRTGTGVRIGETLDAIGADAQERHVIRRFYIYMYPNNVYESAIVNRVFLGRQTNLAGVMLNYKPWDFLL